MARDRDRLLLRHEARKDGDPAVTALNFWKVCHARRQRLEMGRVKRADMVDMFFGASRFNGDISNGTYLVALPCRQW